MLRNPSLRPDLVKAEPLLLARVTLSTPKYRMDWQWVWQVGSKQKSYKRVMSWLVSFCMRNTLKGTNVLPGLNKGDNLMNDKIHFFCIAVFPLQISFA